MDEVALIREAWAKQYIFDTPADIVRNTYQDVGILLARIEELEKEKRDTVKSLTNLRAYCLGNFQGGYVRDEDEVRLNAFVHGMKTVCNVTDRMAEALARPKEGDGR